MISGWSAWIDVEMTNDENPGSHESALMVMSEPTTHVQVRGSTMAYAVHPIRVAHEPASYRVASLVAQADPHILSRSEWGADDAFLFKAPSSTSSSSGTQNGDTTQSVQTDQRVADCQKAQAAVPQEFAISKTVTKDGQGRTYRWPLQYSPSVRLLVVHHTAMAVGSEKRSGEERMRALYQYHANTLGWGDVGYHYVIDESGHIYEGKAGGKNVIGGHAYCNNTGTIGIAMMGNFEREQPTQAQVHALQWLLQDLGQTYQLDLQHAATFHGTTFPAPVVRHRDVLSTACPGYYLASAFAQVIANVRAGLVDADVTFPALPPLLDVTTPASSASSSVSASSGPVTQSVPGLVANGGTDIRLNPGGQHRFDLTYTAPNTGARAGSRIAQIVRSSPGIGLFVDTETGREEARGALTLAGSLAAGDSVRFALLLTAPPQEGTFWFEIGGIRYTLQTVGRRSRLMTIPTSISIYTSPLYDKPLSEHQSVKNRDVPIVSRRTLMNTINSSRSSPSTLSPSPTPRSGGGAAATQNIRIRLTLTGDPILSFTSGGTVGDQTVRSGQSVRFQKNGSACSSVIGTDTTSGRTSGASLRSTPAGGGLIAMENVRGKKGLYRGVVDCVMVDGDIALINELPLEDYMAGLAEEPDTEPLEKQRAFAIAARSYALSYMGSLRKFPGKPYDGSDSPSLFQSYSGVAFERVNPRWVDAVRSTAGAVLTFAGTVLRVPYFSSDDGRTRSPTEAGWPHFPHADIFQAKDDPWCAGFPMSGHGVGMSGCGAKGQALAGNSAEDILQYYYPGTTIERP